MKQMIKKMTVVLSVALVCAPMGAMAANKLIVKDAGGTIDKMVVTDTGYIGIGMSAPLAGINLLGNSTSASQILSQFVGTTGSGGGGFLAYHNNAAGALPNANDRLGYMLFGSYDGISPRNAAGFTVRADGAAWTSSSTPTSFVFETNPVGSIGRIERFKIASSGNIGIGATSPTAKLEINGGLRLNPAANPTTNGNVSPAKPTCNSTNRGTLWFTSSPTLVADKIEVCAKDAFDAYAWKTLI